MITQAYKSLLCELIKTQDFTPTFRIRRFNLTPNWGISKMTRKYANSLIQLTKWTQDKGHRTAGQGPRSKDQKRKGWWKESDCGPDVQTHGTAAPEELKRKQKWNYVVRKTGAKMAMGMVRCDTEGLRVWGERAAREGVAGRRGGHGQAEKVKWINGWMDKGHRMLHRSLLF